MTKLNEIFEGLIGIERVINRCGFKIFDVKDLPTNKKIFMRKRIGMDVYVFVDYPTTIQGRKRACKFIQDIFEDNEIEELHIIHK